MDQPTSDAASASPANAIKRVDYQTMIARLKGFTQDPVETWQQIKNDADSERDLVEKYIAAIIIVPALCAFIGSSILGPASIGVGLKVFILRVICGAAGYFLGAMLVQYLAPTFGGTNSRPEILRWMTFSNLPNAAAVVLSLVLFVPVIGFLVWIVQLAGALFSLYVMWVGTPIMVGVTAERRLPFFLCLLGCGILIGVVMVAVLGVSMI